MFDSFHHSAAHPLVHPLTATGIALIALGSGFFFMSKATRRRDRSGSTIPASETANSAEGDEDWIEPPELGPMDAIECSVAVFPIILGLVCLGLTLFHAVKPQSIPVWLPGYAISAVFIQLYLWLMMPRLTKRALTLDASGLALAFGVYFLIQFLAPVLGWSPS